jgi:hypothetical protein
LRAAKAAADHCRRIPQADERLLDDLALVPAMQARANGTRVTPSAAVGGPVSRWKSVNGGDAETVLLDRTA